MLKENTNLMLDFLSFSPMSNIIATPSRQCKTTLLEYGGSIALLLSMSSLIGHLWFPHLLSSTTYFASSDGLYIRKEGVIRGKMLSVSTDSRYLLHTFSNWE